MKSSKQPTQTMRHARVVLTRAHLHQLLAGSSLTIRLRTLSGEQQLVEMVSPLPHSNQREVDSLMKRVDKLMDEVGKLGIKL